jgi:hypothetical protein
MNGSESLLADSVVFHSSVVHMPQGRFATVCASAGAREAMLQSQAEGSIRSA